MKSHGLQNPEGRHAVATRLSAAAINQVADDLAAEREGKVYFHYVIDPFEIIRFCFPTEELVSGRQTLSDIANDQIALFHFFYTRKEKPILLDEYLIEVDSFRHRLLHQVRNGYNVADRLIASWRGGDVPAAVLRVPQADEPAPALLAENFNVILAIALSLYEEGSRRLVTLLRENVQIQRFTQTAVGGDLEVVEAIITGSRGTPRALSIFQAFFKVFYPQLDVQSGLGYKASRSALRDALAVDRVLSFNEKAEQAYDEGLTKRRHVFLYLSSAHRSRVLFGLPEVRQSLPRFEGERYPVWRTVEQRFALVAHTDPNSVNTLRKLRELADVYSRLGKAATLPEGADYSELTAWVDDAWRLNQTVLNVNLFGSVVKFQDYLDSATRREAHDYIFRFIREARSNPEEYVLHKQQAFLLLDAKSVFLEQWSEILATVDDVAIEATQGLLLGKDKVASTLQRFPLQLRFTSPLYKNLFADLRRYLTHSPATISSEFGTLRSVAERFLSDDEHEPEAPFDPERELFRYVLLIALPHENAEIAAANYALEALDVVGTSSTKGERTDVRQELLYFLTWALRRTRSYSQSINKAGEGMRLFEGDPRFYQGRFLAAYAWLFDEAERRAIPDEELLERQALHDAERALTLATAACPEGVLRASHISGGYDPSCEIVVSSLNNLAFFSAYLVRRRLDVGGWAMAAPDYERARKHLAELKRWFPKPEWEPEFPAYFHTEAYVEYSEALFQKAYDGTRPGIPMLDRFDLVWKLESALKDITTAIRLLPRHPPEHYATLRDAIKELYDSTRSDPMSPDLTR